MPVLNLQAQNLRDELEDAKVILTEASREVRDIERAMRQATRQHVIVYPILETSFTRLNKIRLAFAKLNEVIDDLYQPAVKKE